MSTYRFSLSARHRAPSDPKGVRRMNAFMDSVAYCLHRAWPMALAGGLVILTLPVARAAALDFNQTQAYPAGAGPTKLAITDLDRDGNPDLVVVNAAPDPQLDAYTISVMMGHKHGTFDAPIKYPLAAEASDIAVGDLNDDRKPDVIVTLRMVDKVAVLMGAGEGNLAPPAEYAVGSHPEGVAIGDLNHDGKADIAVASPHSNSVGVFLNTGDGTLTAPSFFDAQRPVDISIADLNGDGWGDVVLASSYTFIEVMLGEGGGVLGDAVPYYMANGSSVDLADMNNDQILDLVVSGGLILVLPGNGDGSFADPDYTEPHQYSYCAAIGDLNGDGINDCVGLETPFRSSIPNKISVLIGNGDATLTSAAHYAAGSSPVDVALKDLDGDGHLDVVTANQWSNNVSVLLGRGDATLNGSIAYPHGGHSHLTVGEFNNDGHRDLAMIRSGESDSIIVMLGEPGGTFAYATSLLSILDSLFTVLDFHGIAIDDVNGDGFADVVASYTYFDFISDVSHGISVSLGRGDGSFTAGPKIQNIPLQPSELVFGNFNGDNLPDLLVTHHEEPRISVYLNFGDGSFFEAPAIALEYPARRMLLHDLNGDDDPDLVVLYDTFGAEQVDMLSVLQGNGAGSFQPPTHYTLGKQPVGATLGDFDRDGVLDLAVTQYDYASVGVQTWVWIMQGIGDGTFTVTANYPMNYNVRQIANGDLNSDGKADLVLTGGISDVSVMVGRGDATFALPEHFGSGSAYESELVDIDCDGDLDVVFINGSVVVMENRTGEQISRALGLWDWYR